MCDFEISLVKERERERGGSGGGGRGGRGGRGGITFKHDWYSLMISRFIFGNISIFRRIYHNSRINLQYINAT